MVAISWIAPVARAPSSWACTCVKATVDEQFAEADSVFVGSVTAVEDSGTRSLATFAVRSVYKGRVAEAIRVAEVEGSGCAVEFLPGNSYTVFARLQRTALATSLCFGTSNDADVLARAGKFRPVAVFDGSGRAELVATELPAGESRAGPISIAVALLAAASAGFAGLRRSRVD